MSSARLAARIEGVRLLATGRLHDHSLVFDKPGRDGTAKANVRPAPGTCVHGVVWELEPKALVTLDRFEGGYERHELEIVAEASERLVAWTYVYRGVIDRGAPSNDYVRHLLDGAREHALPVDLHDWLESILGLS